MVESWLQRALVGRPVDEQLAAFEELLGALWRRAHRTLGEVTLGAIVGRVLHVSVQRYPLLAGLGVDGSGVRFDDLRVRAATLEPELLTGAVRFVVVELLTVLGNLTAEILTPPLHDELARAGPDGPDEHQEPTRPKGGAT